MSTSTGSTSPHFPPNILDGLESLCPNERDVAFELERKLVAWVVLSRLSEEDLQLAWNRHGPVLERFALDILLEGLPTNSDDSKMLQQYLRLLSQVVVRLSPYPTELAQRLLQSYQNMDGANSIPISVHMDVISALEILLVTDPILANSLSLLEIIWNQYLKSLSSNRPELISGAGADADTYADATIASPSSNSTILEEKGSNLQDSKMMIATLEKILSGSNNNEDAADTRYSIGAFHELILSIFSQEGVEDLIPITMVASLIQWITNPPSSLDKGLKISWNEWCLTWIVTRCTPNSRPFHQVLLNNINFHRMLLSHVISPMESNKDDTALRAMAWQALVALVEVNDWDWMLRQANASNLPTFLPSPQTSTLGRATLLCTWIRLASGELRIQLQSLIHSSFDDKVAHSIHGGWQATALPIGHGCARLLQSVVRYLIRFADQPHIPMPIEGEALLHLRQSLEQAMWTAVEYLTLSSNTNLLDSTLHNDRVSLFNAILRLLGTLLMEVDIFDLLEKNHFIITDDDDDNDIITTTSLLPVTTTPPENSSSPLVLLTCLKAVLPVAEDPSLLPGLVHILGDAEDDSEKHQLLIEHLSDPLLEYLEWYWQRGTSSGSLLDDTVAWACTCTELWVQLSTSVSHRRRLCLALLTWIQEILQTNNHPSSRNYLSLALGCYMALSKDYSDPPKEHETRLILRALQLCERS